MQSHIMKTYTITWLVLLTSYSKRWIAVKRRSPVTTLQLARWSTLTKTKISLHYWSDLIFTRSDFTGCSLNIVFIPEYFKIFRTLAFLCFPSVSVCTHCRQVEHQRCSRTGRVQKKSQHFKEKIKYLMNTL